MVDQLQQAQPGLQTGSQQGLGQRLSGASAQQATAPASSLPTADAQTQASVQQALQDPNGGDAFASQMAQLMGQQQPGQAGAPGAEGMAANPFGPEGMPGMPGPAELGIGAGAGLVIAKGLEKTMQGSNPLIVKAANAIDSAPGVKQVSGWLESRAASTSNPRLQALMTRMSPEAYEKQVLDDIVNSAKGRFAKTGAPPELIGQLRGARNVEEAMEHLRTASLKMPKETFRQVMHAGTTAEATAILKKAGFEVPEKTVEKILKSGDVDKAFKQMTKAGLADGKTYKGIMNRLTGLQSQVLTPYSKKHALLQKSSAGPIGRMMLSFGDHVRAIFGGEVGNASQGRLMKMFAPLAIGGMTIGMAMKEAKEAPPGEKVASFFHNFFGTGIGMFVGMQVGNKLLGSTGLVGKLLKGTNVAKFLGKFSVGGSVAAMLGMFVLSIPFQKAGEKLSHMIFGKPTKASEAEREAQGYHPPGDLLQNYSPDKGLTDRTYKPLPPSAEVQNHADQQGQPATAAFSGITPEMIAQPAPALQEQQHTDQTILSADKHSGFNSPNPLLPGL